MLYDISSIFYSEGAKFQELAMKVGRSTSSGTWTSVSSSTLYTFSNENDLFNQLQTVLDNYLPTAAKWNAKADQTAVDTQILESTGYGVISGLTTSAQATPNMTVNVATGTVHMASGARLVPSASPTLAITTSDVTNPRIDIVYVNSTGVISYLAGTPAATPVVPSTPAGGFLLSQISVAAAATTIVTANITDKRKMKVVADSIYQTAGGTATAITLTDVSLINGASKTFIASVNNGGVATTINAIPFYKPGGTIAPTLITGKAYTVWYSTTSACFFIKASAEGTAVAAHVLANDTFSNDSDTGLAGAMPNKVASATIITPSAADQAIPQGYFGGAVGDGKVAGVVVPAANVLAGTTIAGTAGTMPNRGGVNSAALGVDGVATPGRIFLKPLNGYWDGTYWTYYDDANFIAANIPNGMPMFGLVGTGKRKASGNVSTTTYLITVSGLAFTPSMVIAKLPTASGAVATTLYAKAIVFGTSTDFALMVNNSNSLSSTPNSVITANGFTLDVFFSNYTYNWVAYE